MCNMSFSVYKALLSMFFYVASFYSYNTNCSKLGTTPLESTLKLPSMKVSSLSTYFIL